MPNLFPYTNTHELNLDWILQVVKDFQTKYTTFDQALADALAAIQAGKTEALDEISTDLTAALNDIEASQTAALTAIGNTKDQALSDIGTALTNATNAISALNTTVQGEITTLKNTSISQITTAQGTAISAITASMNHATTIIEQLYNTLPSSAQDILGRLDLLDNIITGNTMESFTWLQGSYVYPEGSTPPTPPAIWTESPTYNQAVSSRYMTGVGGRRIRIITDGTIYMTTILTWRNTPPGGGPGAYVPGQASWFTNTYADILLPLDVTAFSIELSKPNPADNIAPTDIPGHIEIQWITDFVSQRIIAPKESSTTADVAREEGEYFFLDGDLYVATDDIAVGDTITEGTNCEKKTVGGELSDLKSALKDNAFDYNKGSVMFSALHNYYVDTDGTIKPLTGFCATDYIPLKTNKITIISPAAQGGNFSSFYDANKNQISNFKFLAGTNSINVPAGAKYVKLTIAEAYLNDTIMLNPASEEMRPWAEIGVNVLEFTEGYYDLETGSPVQNNSYKRSQIFECDDWRKLININQFTSASDYASLWLDNTYVGYEYTALGETSKTYNRVALNYQPANHQDGIELTYTNPFYAEPLINSPFKNLSIGFLGDSITYGVGASNRNTTSYVALMKKQFGEVLNYGVSSTLIAEESGYSNAMCDRYINMSDDLDIVVVYGGTNDWYYGTAWGTTDSTDKTTFLGALNVLMSGLVEKYCGKEIFFVTPMSSEYNNKNTDDTNACGKTMLDYRNAIIERASYHAIPVIDLYSMCNMDVAHNAANKTYYSADGVHPNDAGHKRVHDRIVAILRDYLVI